MKLKIEAKDPRLVAAIRLCELIISEGYKAYIVGGFVRDLIIYNDADYSDIDIATNMPIDILNKKFKVQSNNGESHGTVLVKSFDFYFEVTQFRTESTYADGRRPDKVEFVLSFREDTKRRDFTINAFGLESDFHVIDYHKGISDIKNKLIRCVGDPDTRFSEDYLRMLRALRFAAKFNFAVEEKTMTSIMKHSENIKKISRERIHSELTKVCKFDNSQIKYFYKLLSVTGMFKHIFGIDSCYDFSFVSYFAKIELPYIMYGIYKKTATVIDYKKCFKCPSDEVLVYNTLISLSEDSGKEIDFKLLSKYIKNKVFIDISNNYIYNDNLKKFITELLKTADDLYLETGTTEYSSAISYINTMAKNEGSSGKDIGDYVENYVNKVIKQYSEIKPY